MKHFIEQRYNEVEREIEELEHRLEVRRAERDMLKPRYDAHIDAKRLEREQANAEVRVQLDNGVYVTSEQHKRIKSGEIEVIVRGKKKEQPKEDKNAEAIENESPTVDTTRESGVEPVGDNGEPVGADGTVEVPESDSR